MSRYLIYTLALGEKFHTYASMLVDSIFKIGQWKGDVLILTDVDQSPQFHPSARLFNIRDRQMPAVCHPHNSLAYKTFIQYCADFSLYDYIVYLDADILVTSQRLLEIVSNAEASNKICVMKDVWNVRKNHRVTGRYLLSPEEKEKWANVAICAGAVGFPTNNFGREFIRQWTEINAAQEEETFCDQAGLYALLLRKYEGRWKYFEDTTFGTGLEPYDQTIVHFTGRKERFMYRYFNEVLGLEMKRPTSA